MAVSDSKKCQTMINITGQQMQAMQVALTNILAVKAAFQTHNPDVTGTPLEGNVAAVNNWITSAESLLGSAVVSQMIAAIVPSHRNKALD